MSVRWAILGCGRVADNRIGPAINRADNSCLMAFCSRSIERAEEYRDRHDAELACDHIEDLFAEDIDAVYVATPNALHPEQVIHSLEGGKHVLVDKPMALSVEEAQQMAAAATKHQRLLSVMFQMPFHPANQHALRLIEEGRLGKLTLIRAQMGFLYPPTDNWRQFGELSGGGVAIDLAPHALDLMRRLGGEIDSVRAVTANVQYHYNVEDLAAAILRFESGAIGLLDVGYSYHAYGGTLELLGSEATFITRGTLQQIGPYQTWFRVGRTDNPVDIRKGHFDRCYVAAIEEFADAIEQRRQPAITAADGVRNVELIEAIYESARADRSVALA